MNHRTLKSNHHLSDYLVWLSDHLSHKGVTELAQVIQHASRFAAGSASEYFYEAELALSRVHAEHGGALSAADLSDLHSVLKQIREAFRKIGGA
ncbi:MAG: hypothetical protein ACRD72_18115 [Candidatus Angelobacter sp.]